MSDFSIQPAGHNPVHSVRSVPYLNHVSPNGANRAAAYDAGAIASGPGDRVEISDLAQLLARMREMPDVRHDRVDQVRSAIDRGQYETDDRIESAIEQMLVEEDLMEP